LITKNGDIKMKNWEKFKAEIQAHFPLENVIYQPIMHPDFRDWKTSRPSKETLELILTRVGNVEGKKVLDIGCCLGYHSHMLAKKGTIVTGIDIKSKRIEFSRYLSKIYGLDEENPKFIHADLVDFVESNKDSFDFVLFLNTVHWLFKQWGATAWKTMMKVSEKSNVLFLSYDKGFAHGFNPQKCVEMTNFTNVENIGFPSARARGQPRSIYRFWKGGRLPDNLSIDAQELWDNTYNRDDRIQPSYYKLGLSHQLTANELARNPNVPLEHLPLYNYMQSKDYEIITARKTPIPRIIDYLIDYRNTLNNLKKQGYNPKKSVINFLELSNGKPALRDGHRRLNCILALGEQKMITVQRWKMERPSIGRRALGKMNRIKNRLMHRIKNARQDEFIPFKIKI